MNNLTKTLALTILTIVTLSIIPAALIIGISVPLSAQAGTIAPSSSYLHPWKIIELEIKLPGVEVDRVALRVLKDGVPQNLRLWLDGAFGTTDVTMFYAKKIGPGVYIAYLAGDSVGAKPQHNKTILYESVDGVEYSYYAKLSTSPGLDTKLTIEVLGYGVTTTITYGYAPISVSFDRTTYGPLDDTWVRLIVKDPNWNLDPTQPDKLSSNNVNVTITVINASGTLVIPSTDTLNLTEAIFKDFVAEATETEVNNGVFRFNFTLGQLRTAVGVASWGSGDVVKIKVVFVNYTEIEAEESFTIKSVAPVIELSGSFSDEISVRVTYPDANLKSWGIDMFNITLTAYPKGERPEGYINVTVEETDYNTAVFEGKLTLNWTGLKSKVYDGTRWVSQEIPLQYLISNASIGKDIIVRANMTYRYEGKDVVKELVITPVTPTVTLDKADYYSADIVKVTIVDPDLNDNKDVVEVYIGTVSVNGELNKIQLNLSGTDIPYLNISLLILPGEKPVMAKEDLTLSLVERVDSPGTFDLKLNLSKLYNISKDTWYRVKIGDLTSGKYVSVDFKVIEKEVKVELDKTAYPLPRGMTRPLTVHVRITDPDMNTNPYAKDVISSSAITCQLFNYTGGVAALCTVDNLVETDVNTGVFEGKITLSIGDEITISGVSVPSTVLINGWINVTYKGKVATAKFTVTSASLSVNVTTVKYGDYIKITVVDKDANLDSKSAESITVSVGTSLTLKETDKDTGVFEGEFLVALDGDVYADPAKDIEIEYVDKTPGFITPGADWDELELSKAIKVASFTGKLSTDKVEYGPAATIKVTVTDFDANKYVKSKDPGVSVSYVIEGIVGTRSLTLEETDVNTGVFEGKIDLRTIGVPAKDLVGKRISIVYRDPVDATGKAATATVVVKVISVDGVVSFDKSYYNVGDTMKITIKDMDANLDPEGFDTVSVRVYSDTDPVGTTVAGSETDKDTGVFEITVLISDVPGAGRIVAKPGDKIYVEYEDKFPADYGVTGKSKMFTASVPVGVPVEKPITPEKAEFVDPRTGAVVVPRVGSMVGISVELSNVGIADQVFTAILVITDPEGVVVKVDSISIPLAAGKSGTVTFSYIPKLAGDYTVEVYVVKSLADWTPLGDMLTKVMSVVS